MVRSLCGRFPMFEIKRFSKETWSVCMHDARLEQKYKAQNILVYLLSYKHIYKLKDVESFIEQFNDIFYTTLRECLRILEENAVILVIFC